MPRSFAPLCLATILICVPLLAPLAAAGPVPPPPDQQLKGFQLPPGFEIQLVVSDPDIGQPMNLNFDARGRLWLTHSVEYPYPARGEGVEPNRGRFAGGGDNPPRDRLTVIEIGETGRATRVTHFVEGLNIPIGNTPLKDGSEALVYGIPSIYHAVDKDGDGKADEKTTLYTRFGNIDVHGNASSFTRWIDGWIYGCHGFSNHSEVTDTTGHVVKLHSGNTYRFHADGSYFQQFTWGQVNPFGITFDPLGNLYDSDCHSRPVYQLLRGATYPDFGGAQPPLGFGPTMIDHQHGSTGICGPAYYAADQFPAEYLDTLFICNPVTGRVHRDKLKRFGSTYQCDTQPDFISTSDKWFRPVDVIVGPDGALYIADFCNLIIGHYEAPLDHPDRDRTHGRVWRVVWRGENSQTVPQVPPDLTALSTAGLIERLADPNLQIRTLATNYLVDSKADDVPERMHKAILERDEPTIRAHGLWVLERLGGLDDELVRRLSTDPEVIVRVHLMKMLAERSEWQPQHFHLVRAALGDRDAFVRRAAADALGQHPAADNVPPLLEAWQAAPQEDTHLIYTIRLALRNHVREKECVNELLTRQFEEGSRARLVEIASAAEGDVAADLILRFADPRMTSSESIDRIAMQIARYGTPEQVARLVEVGPRWFADDPERQLETISAMAHGMTQKGLALKQQESLRAWFDRLAPQMLRTLAANKSQWSNRQVPGLPESKTPWGIRHRGSTDGNSTALFWDSIVGGEQMTGILRSPPFEVPDELVFWMCGHNGPPGNREAAVNVVRLVLTDTGEVIAQDEPPRNDTARKYTWRLGKYVGRTAVFEIVDACTGSGYAWIAVGRFAPSVIRVSSEVGGQRLVELVGQFELQEQSPLVASLAADRNQPPTVRQEAFNALQRLGQKDRLVPILKGVLTDTLEPTELRIAAAGALGAVNTEAARGALIEAIEKTPAALQRDVACALAQSEFGSGRLLDAVQAGKASPRLLQDRRVIDILSGHQSTRQNERVAQLTSGLPAPNEQIDRLIAHHFATFEQGVSDTSVDRGRTVFANNCAACHRLGSEGGLVGPQLDGVGNRGLDRLLEDILDPNRNVEVAFRIVTIVTVDGKVITGLPRRREGETIVLADQAGKEFRLPVADIEQQRPSHVSLMPANFGETLSEQLLRDLVAFLLAQRAEAAADKTK